MKPRISDILRVMSAAIFGMLAAAFFAMIGRGRRPSWSFRLEVMLGAYRGTWSLMPVIGVQRWRRVGDALSPKLSAGLTTRALEAPGLDGEWFEHPEFDESAPVLLYFHGGGFVFGSLRTHGNLLGGLAQAAGARGVGLSYRLAPENPAPAALEDALAAYRHLIDSGIPATRIVLCGDSAGGNIVLMTMLALRDAGDEMPAAGVALSPWTDLGNSGDSFQRNAPFDFVGLVHCDLAAKNYLAGADSSRPDLSPLFTEDLTGLPPILIHAGELETLVDQIRAFSARAQAAGSPVTLNVYDDMVHVWHMMDGIIPEAREGIDEVAQFIRSHVSYPVEGEQAGTSAAPQQ